VTLGLALLLLVCCSRRDRARASLQVEWGTRSDRSEDAEASSGELALTRSSLPDPSLGRAYEHLVIATGGTPPYVFTVAEGRLPDGLELGSGGQLTGTPLESGAFPLVLEVVDSSSPPRTAESPLELVVPRAILLSGYGPFAGFPVNPSWEAIRPLDGARFGPFEVRAFPVEVVWDLASEATIARLESDRPSVAIASGVAGRQREAFALERIAQNIERGTDVHGTPRSGTPCVPGAPATLRSTLPLAEIGEALTAAGIEWTYSDDAGTYLCNHLFYELLYATQGTAIPAGFIHVSDNHATVPELTEGWRVILQALADHEGGA
jgi:pyroglutamyl-peptidase